MFAHSLASKKSLIQLGHSDIGCLKAKPRGLTGFPTLHA